jgi:hypothetical protein
VWLKLLPRYQAALERSRAVFPLQRILRDLMLLMYGGGPLEWLCWDQIFSAGTRKMGNFGSFGGKNGKLWSFSVKNGRFWPFGVPGKVASPEHYFDLRVPRKRARRDEQHGHKLLFFVHFGPSAAFPPHKQACAKQCNHTKEK